MGDHHTRDADALFDAFNDVQPKPGASSQAIERTRQALLKRSVRPDGAVESWWSIRTNRNIFAATAFLVIIAVSLALPTLFSPSVATGFAQVREQLDRVRTITFDVRLDTPGAPVATLQVMVRNDGKSREQYSDGRYLVSERGENVWTRLEVNPATNTAHIAHGFPQAVSFDMLRSIRDLPKSAGASPIEPRTINGRSCPGFLIALGADETSQQMRLWVDPETHLPIHGTVTATVEQKRSGGAAMKGPGDSHGAVATFSNFKYNIELEDSRFTLAPPEGYTITTEGSPPKRRSDRWPAEKLLLTVGEGIGPVKFGMSKEQVVEMFGEPEQIRRSQLWHYNSQGFDIIFDSADGGVHTISCEPESLTQRAFQGKTREGIGLGSSPEDVGRAYPDLLEEEPINKDGGGLYYSPSLRLMVTFVDGVVYRLQFSRIPTQEPAANGQKDE